MKGLPLVAPLASISLAAVLALACSKSDSATSTGTTPSSSAPSVLASATPSASSSTAASASASAPTPPSATADTTAAPDAAVAKVDVKKDGGGAATSASSGPVECGTKPLPDCPLQAWMKSNANPPVMTGDLPALATALEKIVAFAPTGYTNWSSVARDGAAAAKSGDLTAAKASCRTCHDQYKQKYKNEMRARKI